MNIAFLMGVMTGGVGIFLLLALIYAHATLQERRMRRLGALKPELIPGPKRRLSVRDVELSDGMVWTHDETTNRFHIVDAQGIFHRVSMDTLVVLSSQLRYAQIEWAHSGYEGVDRQLAARLFEVLGKSVFAIRRDFSIAEDGEGELRLVLLLAEKPADGVSIEFEGETVSLIQIIEQVEQEFCGAETRTEMFQWFYHNAPGLDVLWSHAACTIWGWLDPEDEICEDHHTASVWTRAALGLTPLYTPEELSTLTKRK